MLSATADTADSARTTLDVPLALPDISSFIVTIITNREVMFTAVPVIRIVSLQVAMITVDVGLATVDILESIPKIAEVTITTTAKTKATLLHLS